MKFPNTRSSSHFIIYCTTSFLIFLFFFFFNDTATTEIYTLSLHDALPISIDPRAGQAAARLQDRGGALRGEHRVRSEEHTSELQSQSNLVCRLLLEKKKKMSGIGTLGASDGKDPIVVVGSGVAGFGCVS